MKILVVFAGAVLLIFLFMNWRADEQPAAPRLNVSDPSASGSVPTPVVREQVDQPAPQALTSSIEIVFISEADDEPVEGVRAQLVSGRQRPDPHRSVESDAQGLVSWSDLEPGTYRWTLLSDHVFWVDDTPNGEQPPRRSEPIVLEAGETKRFAITLFGGIVTGKLYLPGLLERRAVVKVFDVAEDGENQEATQRTWDGSFEFSSISSGRKLLSAVAEVEGQHFYFYRRAFSLEPGGRIDLGVIPPIEGPVSDGRIALQQAEKSLDTEAVYGISSLDAILQILNRSVRPGELLVQQVFDVTVGDPFYLHGLPPGEWLLNATSGYYEGDFWPPPRPGFRVDADRVEIVAAPFTGVQLPFVVQSTVRVTIHVQYPENVDPFRTTVVLYSSRRTGEEVRIRKPRTGSKAQHELELPADQYVVLAHPDPLVVNETNFWFCESRADVHGQDAEILIAFRRGTCVQGQVRDSQGNPTRGRPLGVSLPGWTDRNGNLISVYKVVADEQGKFVLPGVPPSRELLFVGGRNPIAIQSGAAGAVTDVALSFN